MDENVIYYDDITIGTKVVSMGRTITETDVINFSMLCGDNRPIYTDIEYARKYSPTGKRLVDPLLVQCLYYSLIDNTEYNAKSARSLLALLGITYLEILKNPSIGDTIHAEQEIINLSDNKPDRGIVTMRLEILNQNNEVLQRSIIAALFGKRIFFEKE